MIYSLGDLVLMKYMNHKHDPIPLLFVIGSNANITEGINTHYITKPEAEVLRRVMAMKKVAISGLLVYQFLKARFNTVLRGYRRYKTPMILELKKWRATELTDKDPEQFLQQNI